jgi:hypothetical protein
MARTPGQFGITKVTPKGDLGQVLEFELSPDIFSCTTEATQEIPRLRDQLDEALGWSTIAPKPVAPIAQALYFGSGHGSIFKSSHENPFANPLLQTSG